MRMVFGFGPLVFGSCFIDWETDLKLVASRIALDTAKTKNQDPRPKLALLNTALPRGCCVVLLITHRVVLHKLLHVAVSPTSVEVVVLHLCVHLVETPVIVVETINRPHHSSSMAPPRTVHKKLSR